MRREDDSCANYNAFGYDPDGRIAYLSAVLFGPNWVPPFPRQQFVGRLEPPRYGPPAYYQRDCLPDGFVPNPLPDYFGCRPSSPYIDPPSPWDPSIFDAIRQVKNFGGIGKSDEDEKDYVTDDDIWTDSDGSEEDQETDGDDGADSDATEIIVEESDDENMLEIKVKKGMAGEE